MLTILIYYWRQLNLKVRPQKRRFQPQRRMFLPFIHSFQYHMISCTTIFHVFYFSFIPSNSITKELCWRRTSYWWVPDGGSFETVLYRVSVLLPSTVFIAYDMFDRLYSMSGSLLSSLSLLVEVIRQLYIQSMTEYSNFHSLEQYTCLLWLYKIYSIDTALFSIQESTQLTPVVSIYYFSRLCFYYCYSYYYV